MKQTIQNILISNGLIPPLSRLILTYADIKHPVSILFTNSKFKKVFNEFNLTPVHILRKRKVNRETLFRLYIRNRENDLILFNI